MNTILRTLAVTAACAALMAATSAANASGGLSAYAAPETTRSYTLVATSAADPQLEGAKNFIASMGDRGINFLGNAAMSQEAKKAEFRSLLNESFDMSTIGRFSLGNYWRTATPAQQQEYLKLFNEMIIKVYSQRFSDYKGQKFQVNTARKESDKDTVVTSFIVPADGPQVQVDWRVRNKNGSYKVVDIVVEGVSMSVTQRSDFASVIQRGGGNVDVLLQHLRSE